MSQQTSVFSRERAGVAWYSQRWVVPTVVRQLTQVLPRHCVLIAIVDIVHTHHPRSDIRDPHSATESIQPSQQHNLTRCITDAVVTCEIKLFSNLFQCFISHVTTSKTEIKLSQPLKEF